MLWPHGPQRTYHHEPLVAVSVQSQGPDHRAFQRQHFGVVGVFDVDWLVQPQFSHLLDNRAASPGAFHGVRFYGAFTAGQRELFIPESGGHVWTHQDQSIDFSRTFRAGSVDVGRADAVRRARVFPPAVSSSPIRPPAAWNTWRTLVRTFFEELAADARFGPEAIAEWWLEVWNEPNEGRFWQGWMDEFFSLYRATAEAVRESRVAVRLGGPAIACKSEVTPEDGPPWMDRFFRFISSNPELPCDLISLHRKGTVTNDPPDPRRLDEAAARTASQVLAIDEKQFAGLTILNSEADEKVGFEVPYAARMENEAPRGRPRLSRFMFGTTTSFIRLAFSSPRQPTTPTCNL